MTRTRGALVSGVLVAIMLVVSACMTTDEQTGFNLINTERSSRGIATLAANETLVVKAQNWSRGLLANSGGVCSGTTLRHSNLTDGAPAGWRALGENVGCSISSSVSGAVQSMHSGFMGSSGHRANILGTGYNNGAVGVASSQLANGMYLVFETQEFAQL